MELFHYHAMLSFLVLIANKLICSIYITNIFLWLYFLSYDNLLDFTQHSILKLEMAYVLNSSNFSQIFIMLSFISLALQVIFWYTGTDSVLIHNKRSIVYLSTPAPSNLLLELNLYMNLNHEVMVHDAMYNVNIDKYVI